MRRLVFATGALVALLALGGCATMPQIRRGSANYLEKGMVSAKAKGNSFYMALGQVDLYDYGMFGKLRPTGKTVDIATVIRADPDTGEVLRIATLQPQDRDTAGASPSSYQNGVAVTNGSSFTLGDLKGGIDVTDMQAYPHWLDAIEAMRKAIGDLSTYTRYVVDDGHYLYPVAAEPRFSLGIGLGFGWGWGWGERERFPHHDRFNRR
jgi:hypothetical protein